MTLYERIWREAASTFGKKRGHAETLTPYSRTWRLVIERAEHALWLWNEKYGPLNGGQRDYAADVICHALVKAREAPDASAVYAHFQNGLTHALNHERVHEGFKRRASDDAELELDIDFLRPVTA